ncbi:hypothetical protein F5887DRAFT_1225825 [Amanita rubescens]|nr:hypothetical protein F5887DRAFT_1225825 [Amanita rubescens]
MTDIDVDPTYSKPTKLRFLKLEGISDDKLDQELAERLGSTSSSDTVLAEIASQLPDKLEFKPGILEEGPTYNSLLPLIAEATATKNFRKLRRLGLLRRSGLQSIEVGEEDILVKKLEAVSLGTPTDGTGLQFVELEGIDDAKLDQITVKELHDLTFDGMGARPLVRLVLLQVAADLPQHLIFRGSLIPKDETLFGELHLWVQAAVITGRYHRIRRLSFLQKRFLHTSDMPSNYNYPLLPDVQNAWETRYQGSHPQLLFNNICNMKIHQNQYSNQVAVIQGSGTGKSRMVDELAKFHPFLLDADFNRPAEGAFPAPDRGIRDHLFSVPSKADFDAKMHYIKFLGAIFQVINAELEKNIDIGGGYRYDRNSLARWWYNHLTKARTRIYSQIIREARKTKHVGHVSYSLPIEQYQKHTKPLLERFRKKVKSIIGEEKVVEVIIYFDEAHTLLTEKSEDEAKGPGLSSYANLCWAATFCYDSPVFFIFLSTNSSLPHFAVVKAKSTSEPISICKAGLNTPINEMPFDCHPQKVRKGKLSMDETASIPFMARFGRPLFWTILESSADGGDISKCKLDAIMELAKGKLLHSPSTAQLSEAAELAAIDNIITLNYEPLRTWSHDPLVASHGRIVFAIPKHGEYMPSPSFCIDTLSKCDENGMLSKGHIEETIARSIMSNAAGCSLKAFIEEVFAEEFANMILTSKPDNVQHGEEFRTTFRNAAVRFTHFINMSIHGGPKKNWAWTNIAWAAFVRSAAIICHTTQPTIGFIIPILLQKDNKIDEGVMSAILVQVKHRVQEGTTNEFIFNAKDVKLFPSNNPIRPYVSLVMDLGMARRVPATDSKSAALISVPPTPQKVSSCQSGVKRGHYMPDDHPRYQVIASGCSAVVYKNVDEEKFGGLLDKHDIFTDHGRLDEGSIEAIKRLKPVWELDWHLTTITAEFDVVPAPSKPAELQYFDLTDIDDHKLDQQLTEKFQGLRSHYEPTIVLAAIAKQLPDKLEFNPDILKYGPAQDSLRSLIDDAMQTQDYGKLRRLKLLKKSEAKATRTDPVLARPSILQFTELEFRNDRLPDRYMRSITQHSKMDQLDQLDPALFVRFVLFKLSEGSPEYLRFQEDLIPGDGTPLFQALHSLIKDAVKTGKYYHKYPSGLYLDLPSAFPLLREVWEAWNIEYQGNNAQLLFDNICNMKDVSRPYSNQVSVTQSSGTGKSRMVHELGKLVFTIPFNLRDDAETPGGAFPFPDQSIRNYLLAMAGATEVDIKLHYVKFLGAIFEVAKKELDENKIHFDSEEKNTRDRLANWWSSHLKKERWRIYSDIINNAHLIRSVGEETTVLPIQQFAQDTEKRLRSLIEKVKSIVGDEISVEVVIYFDEAHTLLEDPPVDGTSKNLFDIFCWVATLCYEFPLFFIFISTRPLVPKLLTTESSNTISYANASLNVPIIETPFDCYPKKVPKGQLSLNETTSIDFLARFGRPLYWTLLEKARREDGSISETNLQAALRLAKLKLLLSHRTDNPTGEGKLAVIDSAITLDYEPLQERNRALHDELVMGHARIIFAIPKHREYMRSGYPSEPILAEAANQILHEWERQYSPFHVVTKTLIHYSQLLSKEHMGKTVARSIMSDAYRHAIAKESASDRLNFSAGCSVEAFVKELFAEKHAEMILKSEPDNVGNGQTFGKTFQSAVVRFTHYITMATNRTSPKQNWAWTDIAWATFVRSAAIICPSSCCGVNVIIPILLQRSGKIDECVMSAILVQIRNDIKQGEENDFNVDAKDINLFPEQGPIRAYVSLVMNLGITQSFAPQNDSKTKKAASSVPAGTPQSIRISSSNRQMPDALDTHQRYAFIATGCSSVVYKDVNKAEISCLLDTDRFRQDSKSIYAEKSLKPVWKLGDYCFNWVEGNDALRASEFTEEGVKRLLEFDEQ